MRGSAAAFELGPLARRHGATKPCGALHLADGSGDSVRVVLRHEVLAAGDLVDRGAEVAREAVAVAQLLEPIRRAPDDRCGDAEPRGR